MQKRIQKETGNNCLKRIIVAFLAVIMMTTMLHPQMVQAATGTENGIFIKSKNNEAPVFEAGKKKNWNSKIPPNSFISPCPPSSAVRCTMRRSSAPLSLPAAEKKP